MYPRLLKKCLLDDIYGSVDNTGKPIGRNAVENGNYWPQRAHTMIGMKRLDNIEECFEDVIKNGVVGDLIETGVWRGGSTIFMKGLVEYHNQKTRKVFVADSFEGLPPPDPKFAADVGDKHHTVDFLRVTKEQVESNFKEYDLLDDGVVFIKGFFEDTMKDAPIDKLCILRLDGDMYSSTIHVLDALYEKVSVGGYIIVDDYGLPACKKAIDDFRRDNSITSELKVVDWTGRYWKKEE